MKNSQKNTSSINKNIIKSFAFFLTFSATFKRETSSFILRKSMNWNFKKYVLNLFLKMTSKKRFKSITFIAPPINETIAFTRLNFYDVHIKISASRRRRFQESWRWFQFFSNNYFFKKDDIQFSFIACIIIRRF